MQKIDRTDLVKFLNITPITEEQTSYSWAIIGNGITSETTDYNSDVSDEHWIINKNANKDVDGYALSSSVEQTAYKGDDEFDFIDDIAYNLKTGTNAVTQLLEIFKYRVTNEDTTPTYKARLWNVAIGIESNGGDGGKGVSVKYSINYKGDPTFGTVIFTSGVPTFTEN